MKPSLTIAKIGQTIFKPFVWISMLGLILIPFMLIALFFVFAGAVTGYNGVWANLHKVTDFIFKQPWYIWFLLLSGILTKQIYGIAQYFMRMEEAYWKLENVRRTKVASPGQPKT